MACTYDVTTDRGKVRLLINDVSTTACVFSDAEIDIFLSMHSSNIYLAAAEALGAWAAKYTLSPESEKIGDYQYTQKTIAAMNKLKSELETKAYSDPILDWAEMDLTEGSGITAEGD